MNAKSFCDNETVKIDYLNGTLDGEMTRDFEEHLRRCERCRTELEELRSLITGLGSVTAPVVPVALTDRVRERLRAEMPAEAAARERSRRNARSNGLIFALCTVGVLLGSLALLFVFASDPVGEFIEKHLFHTVLDTARSLDDYGEDMVNGLGMLFTVAGLLLIPSIAEHLYVLLRNRHTAARSQAVSRAAGSRP
jgi:hypothetical protein